MNKILAVVLVVLVVGTGFAVGAWQLSAVNRSVARTERELSLAKDSVALTRRILDSMRAEMPGLGEFMSGIQLHAGKLWYAERASNWLLASYELHELGEAVDAVEGLHTTRNNVDISSVLQSIQGTQLAALEHSIVTEDHQGVKKSYNELLSACNGCHQSAGYGFIKIITPKSEPVSNQEWNVTPSTTK